MSWPLLVIAVAVGVLVGWMIGQRKGLAALGAALGLLSLVGWIIIALIPARAAKPVPASLTDFDPQARRPTVDPGAMPQHPPDIGGPMRSHEPNQP